MTRVTLSEFKNAARKPSSRRPPSGSSSGPPVTPMPQAQSAIRRLHQQGVARATMILHQTFDRSGYWGPSGPAPAKGWANAIKACFDTYARLASADDRPAIMTPVKRDVGIGSNSIGVAPDVILLDPDGYVARLVLWDTPRSSQDEAALLAAPIVAALDDELGAGRTVGVEVWHLRSGEQFFVTSDEARARLDDVNAILVRYIE